MGKSQQFLSEKQIEKRVRAKRGQGVGSSYVPWLFVRDVPSQGRSQRIFSHRTQRVHHLLSDIEQATFLILDWCDSVRDIREQFPLDRDQTRDIAAKCGIAHPSGHGVDQVMSSDFVVDTSDPKMRRFVLQAKSSEALSDPRTIEKLEIERRYWASKDVPWYLVTEREIDPVVNQNIKWLHPAQAVEFSHPELLERIGFFRYVLGSNQGRSLVEVCQRIDAEYDLELGQSLRDLRVMLSKRLMTFDISQPVQKLRAEDLRFHPLEALERVLDVENQ